MTLEAIERRLSALRPSAVIVTFTVDGGEKTGTVSQMIEAGGEFVRCISGKKLTDIDMILGYVLPPGG